MNVESVHVVTEMQLYGLDMIDGDPQSMRVHFSINRKSSILISVILGRNFEGFLKVTLSPLVNVMNIAVRDKCDVLSVLNCFSLYCISAR